MKYPQDFPFPLCSLVAFVVNSLFDGSRLYLNEISARFSLPFVFLGGLCGELSF